MQIGCLRLSIEAVRMLITTFPACDQLGRHETKVRRQGEKVKGERAG